MEKVTLKKGRGYKMKKAKWGYIFLLPWLLIFTIFYAYPLIYGIVVSFMNYTLRGMSWNGVGNYAKIFTDYSFWRSLAGTVRYAVIIIPLQVFIPLWAANTLRPHGTVMNNVAKVLIYLPGVLCTVALIIVWKFLLHPSTGLLNQILSSFGIANFSIFDNANYSIPVLSLLIVFSGLGSNLIIYSAALNGISQDYYDAADLDGATHAQQFWKLTIPLVRPTMIYVLVTATIAALQVFVVPKLMTGGGPNFMSSTLLMLIYDTAFTNNQFGYASAIGVILFILTGIVAIIQFRVTQHDTVEY